MLKRFIRKTKARRMAAAVLSICMVCSLFPATVSVGAPKPGGGADEFACGHVHDKTCGYVEAIEGAPCAHDGGDGAYLCDPAKQGAKASESEAEGGYVCDHTDGCGYIKAVTGAACRHTCEICSPQEEENGAEQAVTERIDALPDVDRIYEDMPGDVDPEFAGWLKTMKKTVKEIRAVKTAYDKLSEGARDRIDAEHREKLSELVDFANLLDEREMQPGTDTWIDRADTDWYTGNESASSYEISGAEELAGLAYLVNIGTDSGRIDFNGKTVTLTGDLDLAGYDWIPIGNGGGAFWGTFDGGDAEISHMNISIDGGSASDRYGGLFGSVCGGKIQNIRVAENSTVQVRYTGSTGPAVYAAVVGQVAEGATVENCHNGADVSVPSVDNAFAYVAGVVGHLKKGTVKNCSNSGEISGTSVEAGGVVGVSSGSGTVKNCWNTGDIILDGWSSYAGGIIGDNSGSGTVKNCYSTGDIEGKKDRSYYGGVAGSNSGTVENCYSAGILTLPSSSQMSAGGAIGDNYYGNARNCYWRSDIGANGTLTAVGDSGQEEDVLSFGAGGAFDGGGSVSIGGADYSSLLPALNAWTDSQATGFWYWTGDRAAPELTEERPPDTYEVTVKVQKDDTVWGDHEKTFRLVDGATAVTNLNAVTDGTYDVYEGSLDTGMDVTVDGVSAEVTVDYYTVTFCDGNVPYADTTPQAPQILLKGKKAAAPSGNPVKENHIFTGWVTEPGGTTAFSFDNTDITRPTRVYAAWNYDTSTEVDVILSVSKNGPYYKDDELTLKVTVTNRNTSAEVRTGTVQFYKDGQVFGEPVGYSSAGMGEQGFVLSVVCGPSVFIPALVAGAENRITAVYTPVSGTEITTDPLTITVADKKNGSRYIGANLFQVETDGSDKEVCPIQFTVTNKGENEGIGASQFCITGSREGRDFTDFTLEYNGKDTIAYVYLRQPGSYEFTATLDNRTYIGAKTFAVTVTEGGQTYAVSLDPADDKTFADATEGYGEQTPHRVTVRNSGNQDTGTLLVALSGANKESFTLSEERIDSIAVGGSGEFTVKPVTGLAAGTYTAAVTVSGGRGISAGFHVSFTVKAKESVRPSTGSSHSSSNSSHSSSPTTTTTTTATENGGSIVTTQTTAKDSSGKITQVTTQVTKDASGNVTGSTTAVTTEHVTVSRDQGNAVITVQPDASAINSAAVQAGASKDNPMDMTVLLPQQTVISEAQRAEVNTVHVDVILENSAAGNAAVRTVGVTIEKETVEAARQSGKVLETAILEENRTVRAAWSFDGESMRNVSGQATDLTLGVHTAPVQSEDPAALAVKPQVTAKGHENGLVLTVAIDGMLLASAKLTVPAVNRTGLAAGSAVVLYRQDPVTGALNPVSDTVYTVAADGNVTVDIPAGLRIGAKESYVLLPAAATPAASGAPAAGAGSSAAGSGAAHTVRKGDTLNQISRQYGCRPEDLLALNPGLDVYNLRIGSEIAVPAR